MAGRKDYYAILGVAKDASQDEVKRAYRKLARKLHPDVNPGDAASEERFKEVSEAYHVLGDADRRKQYDQVGPDAFAQEFDMSDFAEHFRTVFRGGGGGGAGIFEEIFGGGARGGFGGFPGAGQAPPRSHARRGADVRVEVELALEEAARGSQRTVAYRDASGKQRTARVKVPAGVRDGQQIRVRGKGEPGAGGAPAGDLYLSARIAPHPQFELEGGNLRVVVPVTVYEAGLGATVEVPTLDGSTRIKVPAGTRNGQVFKVAGRGAPGRNGDSGDLLVRIEVALPPRIDDGTREILESWRDEQPYEPRSEKET